MRHPTPPPPQARGPQQLEYPYWAEPFEDGQLRYLRSLYVLGDTDVDEFERRVSEVLADGRSQTSIVIYWR